MRKCDVGGQAVIEGVMMRGSKGMATAIRTPKGKIKVSVKKTVSLTKKYKILSLPFIRGITALLDSLIIGIKTLNYSASFFEEEEEESAFEKLIKDVFGEKLAGDLIITLTMMLSFVVSIGIFIGIPTSIASIFKTFGFFSIILNLIEASIRIAILILYMFLISNMEDIYRVFQYHGAEHKTIFCYENEQRLTIENVKKQSRLHPRCGTNFIFLTMFVSILLYTFTGWGNFIERIIIRIVLLPVVAGISYEIIKWLGRSESKLSKIIAYPGLMLQKLTTKEPDDMQIEVAIKSLMAAEGIKDMKTIGELLIYGNQQLKEAEIDTYILDCQLLLTKVLNKDKIYLILNKDEEVSNLNENKFKQLIKKRKEKMPMAYILKDVEFMGLDFYVEEGVLIPRGDTEVLVEEVLKYIGEEEAISICDLCCGSGAIGISLAALRNNIKVDLVDFYPIPEKVTKKNIVKHNLEERTEFIKSDLLNKVIEDGKKYDILVSNPPYIADEVIDDLMEDVKDYEPHTALAGGEDGMDFYNIIVSESRKVLNENGILAFEIGYDQGEKVKVLMEENGFKNIKVIQDLAGLDRVVIGNF